MQSSESVSWTLVRNYRGIKINFVKLNDKNTRKILSELNVCLWCACPLVRPLN
jgi:hypothetical protein